LDLKPGYVKSSNQSALPWDWCWLSRLAWGSFGSLGTYVEFRQI